MRYSQVITAVFNVFIRYTCYPTPFPTESCRAAKCLLYAVPAKPPGPPLVFEQNVSQSLVPPVANCRSKRCQQWTQKAKNVLELV